MATHIIVKNIPLCATGKTLINTGLEVYRKAGIMVIMEGAKSLGIVARGCRQLPQFAPIESLEREALQDLCF